VSITGVAAASSLAVATKYASTTWHDGALETFTFVAGRKYIIVATATLVWEHDHGPADLAPHISVSCVTNIANSDHQRVRFAGSDLKGEYSEVIEFTPTAAQAGDQTVKIQYGADYAGANLSLSASTITVLDGVKSVFSYFPKKAGAVYPAATAPGDFLSSTGAGPGVYGNTNWTLRRKPSKPSVLEYQRPDGAWDDWLPFDGRVEHHFDAGQNPLDNWMLSDTNWHDGASIDVDFVLGHRYLIIASARLQWNNSVKPATAPGGPGMWGSASLARRWNETSFIRFYIQGAGAVLPNNLATEFPDHQGHAMYDMTFTFTPHAGNDGVQTFKIRYTAAFANSGMVLLDSKMMVVEL
jgi:hypothetical protein